MGRNFNRWFLEVSPPSICQESHLPSIASALLLIKMLSLEEKGDMPWNMEVMKADYQEVFTELASTEKQHKQRAQEQNSGKMGVLMRGPDSLE